MATTTRWTSADLELMPDDGKRYEIIDGELYMSRQPHFYHQFVCGKLFARLDRWNEEVRLGEVIFAPGVIFAEDDDVAPDAIWISNARLVAALGADGKFHSAPELVIEVLSPGATNERRDREAKLKLYSRRGVSEYWIVNWQTRQIHVYRRENTRLELVAALLESDSLESPLLPGFVCPVASLFARIPVGE
jgi:Uma2 family endonuclease